MSTHTIKGNKYLNIIGEFILYIAAIIMDIAEGCWVGFKHMYYEIKTDTKQWWKSAKALYQSSDS